jgi:hypothetical protein
LLALCPQLILEGHSHQLAILVEPTTIVANLDRQIRKGRNGRDRSYEFTDAANVL